MIWPVQQKGIKIHYQQPFISQSLKFVVRHQEKEDAWNVPVLSKFVMLYTCNLYTSFFMKVNWDNMHSNFEGIDWLRCSRKIPNHFSKNISIKSNLGIIIEYILEKILKQNGEIVHYHNDLKSHFPQMHHIQVM